MKQFIKLFQVFILVLLWGAASAQAPYCSTPYSSGCIYGDGLILFQLNTINQSIPCTGTPSYYHDYTALTTTMQTGTPYVITMQAGYSSTYVDIWVDLNNNNVFDQPGERLVNDFVCASSYTNYTTNITIPMGTSVGNHRLRFRTEWAGAVTDPCTSHYYGNAADFTINVTAGGPPPPPPPATVTIGTGTSSCAYPYTTYWMDGRTQMLFTASEIIANGGAPGEISSIGFNVYSYNNQTMNNFSIKLMNTTMTSITSWTNGGMTECYLGQYAVPGNGWQMINLQTPFVWDGSNLLVEICYDNTSYTYYSFVYGTSAPGMIYYYYTDLSSGSGCNFTTNYSTTIRPNFRFVVQPWIGTVQGTVTSNFNGSPINGATVTIAGVPPVTTNVAGAYTIYNVPTGVKNVTATATGYLPKTKQTTVVNLQTSTVDFALDPIPAYLTGVVTNAATGSPVIGARVSVNNAPYNSTTYSIAGGAYTLNIYPVGNLTVTASKPGFDNFTAGPFTFTQGNTQLLDIPLLENTNAPGLFTAALNSGETAVDLNWAVPSGLYEVIYDDGVAENFTVWATGGNQNAVKFTPVGYPATVIGGKVNIGMVDDYPSGANPLVPFKMAIYDDDGTGGLPGTAIDTMDVTPTALGWVSFTFPAPVTVNSGSFYLVMIQGGNFPDAAGIKIDETAPPSLRSYARFVTGGGPWIPASGDFLMRAIVNGPGGPLDVDLLEPKFVEATAVEGAMYDHQPLPTSGYQAVGKFLPFDYSSLTVNSQTDGSQPTPVTSGPSVEEGTGVTGYNGTTVELDPTDAVLYNNGPLVNSPGTGPGGTDESVIQAPINSFGFNYNNALAYYVTDDFTVTGNGWLVTSVDLYGYQTGSTTTSTFTGAYIQIWNGQPGTAGATVVWGNRTTNRMVSTSFSNIYRVNAVNGGTTRPIMKITASTPGLTLNAGTYWIEYSTTGSLASGPWVPPVTLNNIPITGNALQWTGSSWVALDSPAGSGNFQGVPFILNGSTISPAGNLTYEVWRLLQGQEGNQGVWTSLGTTNTTTMVDNSWPSLPCNPYRWAVKAIYAGNRLSPATFSNVLGKCWVADVTVHVTLTCAAHPEENTLVKLQNTAYPDTMYQAMTDTNGMVFFDNVWKGNYTLTVIRFGYDNYSQVVDITGDQTIEVMLLQQKTPPTNLFVDDRSLEAIWNQPRSAVVLFNEAWTSGNFATNQWTTSGGSNWMMTTGAGNPAPSAMFNWSPQVTNYNQFLTSKQFTGVYSPSQLLQYDIFLSNFGTTYENTLAVEIWDGTTWTVLKTYTNMNGSINWTTEILDISAYNDISFRIRFHAAGEDSYDINNWNVDNIKIVASDGTAGVNPCVLGYNFYLNNVLSAFVMDTTYTIPGNQVQYGQTYNACVNAVYGSGYSTQSCYTFTSHFLYPPLNLEVEAIECSAYLTWEQPQTLDLVRVPAYKGTVENTPAETGLAPLPDGPRASTINRNADGTIIFGFEAFADGTVDFDVDNVAGFTFIGGNTASDFINGMVFLPGQPDDAYGVAYGGGNLYSINRATGVMSVVGYLGSTSLHDLAIDPLTGIIYGTSLTALYTIDVTVPSVTLVGNHGSATTMIAIGCDGSGDLYGYDITTDLWYSIDKTTGAATSIGSIGFNSSYAQGMFYDQPTGTLMMAAYNAGNSQCEIRAVDVTTGASVILSNATSTEVTGAAYPITSGGGGQVPDGLIGYNVYRDGMFIAFVSGPDTTWYYDLNLDPDNYEYAVTAKYDLTDYGFPGQFDESMIEGPETVSIMCGRPLTVLRTVGSGDVCLQRLVV